MRNELIEIQLLNGKKTLLRKEWDKIYDVEEKTVTCVKLCKRFPFFTCEKVTYVKFSVRTHYEYLNSILDPRFRVRCTLRQFTHMFDIDIKPFECSCIDADLKAPFNR